MTEQARNINTGGGAVFNGNTSAGRDVIGRDQINNYNQHYQRDALHQLRAIPETFTGRGEEIAKVVDFVRERAAEGGAVAITSGITGLGGIGKTELANVIARALREAYPDAQLLLELNANGAAPRTPTQALAALLQQFYPADRLPEDEPSLRQLYLNTLSVKRAIVILDDCGSDADARRLLPPAGCVTLITSRHSLATGERLRLAALPRPDAIALLRRYRPALSDDQADALAALCADLPIALSVAGSLLSVYASMSAGALIASLKADRIGGLAYEDQSVQRVFAASYERLSPELQQVWRALAIMPADFDLPAAAVIGRFDAGEAPGPLDEFTKLNMLEFQQSAERFNWHDLLRDFGKRQLKANEIAALKRIYLDYYKSVANCANVFYRQGGRTALLGLELFDKERAHLEYSLSVLKMEVESGLENIYFSLSESLLDIGQVRFLPLQQVDWLQNLISRFSRSQPNSILVDARIVIGGAYAELGNYGLSVEYRRRALEMASLLDDKYCKCRALSSLAGAIIEASFVELDRINEAKALVNEALAVSREVNDRKSECDSLDTLGTIYLTLAGSHIGNNEDMSKFEELMSSSLASFEEALQVSRTIGDMWRQSRCLFNLSKAQSELGNTIQAIEFLRNALLIAREIEDIAMESRLLKRMKQLT